MFLTCSMGRKITQYHGNLNIPICTEAQHISIELKVIVISNPKGMSKDMSYFGD